MNLWLPKFIMESFQVIFLVIFWSFQHAQQSAYHWVWRQCSLYVGLHSTVQFCPGLHHLVVFYILCQFLKFSPFGRKTNIFIRVQSGKVCFLGRIVDTTKFCGKFQHPFWMLHLRVFQPEYFISTSNAL